MKKDNLEAKVIARAWKDPQFKKRLLENPKAVLNEIGYELPDNLQVRVIEDTQDTMHLVLPCSPAKIEEMPNDQLEQIAGGGGGNCSRGAMTCTRKCSFFEWDTQCKGR